MLDHFFYTLSQKIQLTEQDKIIIGQQVERKKVRKQQYILQENDISKYVIFVNSGILRSYTTDGNGNDHIIQFAPEGWFISDLYSLVTGEQFTQNIDAIEDSELVLISIAAYDHLQNVIPQFLRFNYLQMRAAYIALQKRLTDTFLLSSEEKYLRLINTYPDILHRVPQYMIASYMGLTPETLSRVKTWL